MGDSTIEWTEKTWNPLVGCEYASEGCRGCYAARGTWDEYPEPMAVSA